MTALNRNSRNRLATCHADLERIILQVAATMNLSVLWGYRNQEDQDTAYGLGHTKLRFPHSLHNRNPSLAVDVAPFPLDFATYQDPRFRELAMRRYSLMAGSILQVAKGLGINLRWGGDWQGRLMDPGGRDLLDVYHEQRFDDLGHFELWEARNEHQPGG